MRQQILSDGDEISGVASRMDLYEDFGMAEPGLGVKMSASVDPIDHPSSNLMLEIWYRGIGTGIDSAAVSDPAATYPNHGA